MSLYPVNFLHKYLKLSSRKCIFMKEVSRAASHEEGTVWQSHWLGLLECEGKPAKHIFTRFRLYWELLVYIMYGGSCSQF